MKRLLFVILLTIMGCCGVHVQAVGYEKIINPVLPGDRPDPTVIEINGEYWAAATSNEWSPLFPIFKSKDLVNWELVNYVFPDGAPDWALNNFWAPELSYDEKQGKVYLYYTARDKRTKRLSCAAAVADSPMGRFKDLGPLVAQEPGSIDAFAARDEKGKLYLIWKEDGNSMGLPTNIWAQEMTRYANGQLPSVSRLYLPIFHFSEPLLPATHHISHIDLCPKKALFSLVLLSLEERYQQ